jgi:hypothetical protein
MRAWANIPSKILIALVLLPLTSCADFQARMAEQRAAQQQAINDGDDAQCRSYGATPGSDDYVACRMNLTNNRQRAAIAAADRGCAAIANQPPTAGFGYLQAQCAAQGR